MKIAIVGSRTWTKYEKIIKVIDNLPKDSIIVSGGCDGVDIFAERYATLICGWKKEIYYPDWKTHGKSAGHIRNELIIQSADVVYAFVNKDSVGTLNSIAIAIKRKKPLHIINEED